MTVSGDTLAVLGFAGTDGLSYDFDPKGSPAAFMVERHVSGDWRYARQPQR